MIIMDLLLAWVTLRMFATGYKLKT
jgi:hypothetical protein